MGPINQAYKAHMFRACASIRMSETRARLWDAGAPGSYEHVLDDDALREKLKGLVSDWTPSQVQQPIRCIPSYSYYLVELVLGS
jgi:hypothetical protein